MNLRLIRTKQNFKNFVAAILYLDLLLNGSYGDVKNSKKNYFIIRNLLNNNLDLPPFILNCFESFKQTKKQIAFNLYYLDELVDKNILNSFPNLKTLIIDATRFEYSYSFSLMGFLDIL